MKFDLDKALYGAPVVTRDGRKATDLYLFDVDAVYPLGAVVGDDLRLFTREGRYNCDGEESSHDLFLATPTLYEMGNKYITEALKDEDVIYEAFSADAVPTGMEKTAIWNMREAIDQNDIDFLRSLLEMARMHVFLCAATREMRAGGHWPYYRNPLEFLDSDESTVGRAMRGEDV